MENYPILNAKISINVKHALDMDVASVKELHHLIRQFVFALDIGMFPPGSISERNEDAATPDCFGVTFLAKRIPLECFAVLHGMIVSFEEVFSPLVSATAINTMHPEVNLLHSDIKLSEFPVNLPSWIQVDLASNHTTPPLEIIIQYKSQIPQDERARFIREMQAWSTLLNGGYGDDVFGVGQSAVVEPSIQFILPDVLRFHTEQWFGSKKCIYPLLNLIDMWENQKGIHSVQITCS